MPLPSPTSPWMGAGIFMVPSCSARRTWLALQVGRVAHSRAATPVTCGVAMEVPSKWR